MHLASPTHIYFSHPNPYPLTLTSESLLDIMGGCMSSEATKVENRRTSDPKKPVAAAAAAPTTAPPAQAQAGAATTDASAAANGTTAAVAPAAAGPNGTNSATQGLSAALAQAPEAAGAGNKTGDKSNSIDRQLEDDSKKFKKECKLLLLGELFQCWRKLTPQAPESQASRPLSSR